MDSEDSVRLDDERPPVEEQTTQLNSNTYRVRDNATQTDDEEFMKVYEEFRKKVEEMELKRKAKEARKAEFLDRIKNGPKPKAQNLGPEAVGTQGEVLYEKHDRRIVRLDYDRVKKIGGRLRNHEVDNMLWVAENTTIPIPKIYEAKYEDGKLVAIIMEYIPGIALSKVWNDFTDVEKETTKRELQDYMAQLRIPRGNYVGAANQGQAIIGNLGDLDCGPFDSVEQFNEFILATTYEGFPEGFKDDFRAVIGRDHEIVFTHGDFYPRNILVDDDGHVKAILDWEHAGWYPDYFEMFLSLSWCHEFKGWKEFLRSIVPSHFSKEFIAMTWITPTLKA